MGGIRRAPQAECQPATRGHLLRFSGLLYQELSISAGTTEVSIGYQQVYLPAARAEPGSLTRHDDHHDIRIVPVGGTQAVIKALSGNTHVRPAG